MHPVLGETNKIVRPNAKLIPMRTTVYPRDAALALPKGVWGRPAAPMGRRHSTVVGLGRPRLEALGGGASKHGGRIKEGFIWIRVDILLIAEP